MRFVFTGYDGTGAIVRHYAEADSAEEAEPFCPFPPNRRLSGPRRAIWSDLGHELTKTRLSIGYQAMFLAQVGGAVLSGQSANRTFIHLMRDHRKLRKEIPRVENELLVSKRLELLGFDYQAVLLAEIGEDTSTLGESLMQANETLLWREEVLAELKKGLIVALLMIAFAVVTVCSVSVYMTPRIREFTTGGDLQINKNTATSILFGIHDVLIQDWWIIALIAVAIFMLRHRLANWLAEFPYLDRLFEYFRLQRGIRFLTNYKPLFDVNVSYRTALTQLAKSSRGHDRRVFNEMLDRMNRDDAPLSDLIDHPSMPRIVREGFRNFENGDAVSQERVMNTQLKLCQIAAREKVTVIRRILGIGSLLLTVGAVILLVVGGY